MSAARLAAVQALYQMEMTGAPLEDVLAQFLEFHRAGVLDQDETPVRPKSALFTEILRGTTVRRAEIRHHPAGRSHPVLAARAA